jgi:hypothetical protein
VLRKEGCRYLHVVEVLGHVCWRPMTIQPNNILIYIV